MLPSVRRVTLSFVALATLLATQVLSAMPVARAATVATLIQTVETSAWGPASPDPSGLEYLPDQNQLVVADGEVDETTGAGWNNVNVWFAGLANPVAQPTGFLNTKAVTPTNNEPVGVAYDVDARELYIGKDGSSSRVWVYGPGSDLTLGTSDDVLKRSFAIWSRGVQDGEGLAFGDGRLWVADGGGKKVWWFGPGDDGVIGTEDDPQGSWDTLAMGQTDPEGIDYDPTTGNLWVLSNARTSGLLEVTTSGVAIRHIPISFLNPQHPGGLAIAPSTTGDGSMSVWVADRGVDNGSDPAENDGRLYELAITEDSSPPPSNLVVNGGFEDVDGSGRPQAWTPDVHFTRSSDASHSGTFAGRHFATNDAGYKVQQDVSIQGSGAFVASGFVNVPATSDSFKLILKIQWRSTKTLSTATVAKFTKATNGWVGWSANLTAPAGATTARILMTISSLNATIYVDDFSLAAAP